MQTYNGRRLVRTPVRTFILCVSFIFVLFVSTATEVRASSFHYRFSVTDVLEESGSMQHSSSPYFWLNSGGQLILKGGKGHTVQGKLPTNSHWQAMYDKANPLDTDNGHYPQNLFRLVTKRTWNNVTQDLRFSLNALHETDTPNRDDYSGILLMSRYFDGNNLYYAGIRMDGSAVIKKKQNGTYHTLASSQVFGSASLFNKQENPNLLPLKKWMRLRSKTETLESGSVRISLYLDESDRGSWKKILEVVDATGDKDGAPLTGSSHTGIRTDYLDVSFDDYRIENT